MLPRSGRPHDQLLRATVVAGIGGLVVGHILWLIAISSAIFDHHGRPLGADRRGRDRCAQPRRAAGGLGRYQQKSEVWAAFLLCLPVSPGCCSPSACSG